MVPAERGNSPRKGCPIYPKVPIARFFVCTGKREGSIEGRLPLLAGKEEIVEQERRRSPRYPFIATAELVEQSSETRMVSRVSELGLHGCYLDMMNPFPQGTKILVKIFTDSEYFESLGTVAYAQHNMGMGVKFEEVKPHFTNVLNAWLLKAMGARKEA